SACTVAGSVLLLACFIGWDGGSSSGARYLIFALPCLCVFLPVPSSLSPRWRLAYFGCIAVSVWQMFVIAAVNPMAPKSFSNVWTDLLYPKLFQGEFPLYTWLAHTLPPHTNLQLRWSAFNWGSFFLGRGWPTLLPFFALCAY